MSFSESSIVMLPFLSSSSDRFNGHVRLVPIINTYGEHGAVAAGANDDDEDREESNSTFASPGGSRKPSLTNSPPRDESKPSRKTLKSRAAIQKLVDEAVDYEKDGQGQDELGAQSLHGKGLGYYAPLVCDRVEAARLVTT
ncbi:hypothetical protein EDD21DRAFT_448343 [Dissophora ornata]|nr:hypothetical protein EDD21DRAFT_448343 [Dissophora ornata]